MFEHSCPLPPDDFPDHETLSAGDFRLQELFSDLEKVSFGERLKPSKPFQFHPLWLECTRHSIGPERRVRYARQVLMIGYHMIIVDHGNINVSPDSEESFVMHVRKCLQVCKRFRIGLDDLNLANKVSKVFKDIERVA